MALAAAVLSPCTCVRAHRQGGFNRPNIQYAVVFKELIGKQDDVVEVSVCVWLCVCA
jgi:hypothetical protein